MRHAPKKTSYPVSRLRDLQQSPPLTTPTPAQHGTLHGRRLAHIGQISNMCGTGVCTFMKTWTDNSLIPDHTHIFGSSAPGQ